MKPNLAKGNVFSWREEKEGPYNGERSEVARETPRAHGSEWGEVMPEKRRETPSPNQTRRGLLLL